MSNIFKMRKLIQAWLYAIYLEELSNAEVEVGKNEKQKVWEKGIQLVGDQLLIDQTLFRNLKKMSQQQQEKENQPNF